MSGYKKGTARQEPHAPHFFDRRIGRKLAIAAPDRQTIARNNCAVTLSVKAINPMRSSVGNDQVARWVHDEIAQLDVPGRKIANSACGSPRFHNGEGA